MPSRRRPRTDPRSCTTRARYGWRQLLPASRTLVEEYRTGFAQAMSEFDAQDGTRVVVRVPAADLSRSRSSRGQRWVMDSGRRTLGRFVVYALRRQAEPSLDLRVEDAYVLDEMREGGYRVLTFYVAGPVALTADGRRVARDAPASLDFEAIALEAGGAALRTGLHGTVTVRPGRELRIDFPGSGVVPRR